MTDHAVRVRSARLRRSAVAVFVAALGLACLAASRGVSHATSGADPAHAPKAAGSGVPQPLKPTVTHEPYAYELLGIGCSQ
jgi:hypothetical protein